MELNHMVRSVDNHVIYENKGKNRNKKTIPNSVKRYTPNKKQCNCDI